MPGARPDLCILCKGYRNLCGLGYCPLVRSLRANIQSLHGIGNNLELTGSTPPSVIVGEKGYPRVRLYYGVPPGVYGENAKEFDNPVSWFMRKTLGDIMELRSRLLNIVLTGYVNTPERLYEKEVGLAAVSVKPVDTEVLLSKKPVPRISFDAIIPPRGPAAPAKKVRVVGNPVLPRKLDKIIWDDVKASDAVWELYKSGVDFYTITRAFTLGFIGRRMQKKLVPTRWGITAIDSLLTEKMLSVIRSKPLIDNTIVFYGEYLYNKYVIVLYPSRYTGTWIEVWHPKSLWNPSREPSWLIVTESFSGKLSVMDGGYLAARTSVVEYLYSIGRQAGVVILREVMPQYIFPVGNWQIRETVKYALKKQPVLKNPKPDELRGFIKKNMKVPDKIIDVVLKKVYKVKHAAIDEWF
ncbi:hypothetical protein J4526_09195 [Desulfurococcaceae archaeon MEX13E-LK6-19]|nr:hypothetical protein J4526_09195 [Desulfurococcaceae archaeon MEX13E-LK6-19]